MKLQTIIATCLGTLVLILAGQSSAQSAAPENIDPPRAAVSPDGDEEQSEAAESRWSLRVGRRPFHYSHRYHFGRHHRYGKHHGRGKHHHSGRHHRKSHSRRRGHH